MESHDEKLKAQIAGLESQMDLLETEISQLNDLLCKSGFSNGVTTLKNTIEEFLREVEDKNPFKGN